MDESNKTKEMHANNLHNHNEIDIEILDIEIIYASDPFIHLSLSLKKGSTIKDALEEALARAQILERCPELTTEGAGGIEALKALEGRVGIFSRIVPLDTTLKAGDRIEIYRCLHQDPKEARRKRAKRAKNPLTLNSSWKLGLS